MGFKTTLRIEKQIGTSTKWVLIDPLHYTDFVDGEKGGDIIVPRGFKTDLATNWIRGRHDEASVVHDYLLKQGWKFSDANQVMNRAMIDTQVRFFQRQLIMAGVRLNGWIQERRR